MKALKWFILIIATVNISCSKQEVVLSESEIPDGIFYLKNEIKPFTGTCLVYFHGTEVVKEEMSFKKGVLNGKHISYFKNGQVKRIGHYNSGNLNGMWMGFDSEGNKTFEVEYKNDTLIGRFISWYSTGVIKQKGSYLNNEKIGTWLSYDEAGMLLQKIIL